MLDTLFMFLTHVRSKVAFICFIILIGIGICVQAFFKVDSGEEWILSHYLVENVEVKREFVNGLDIFQ